MLNQLQASQDEIPLYRLRGNLVWEHVVSPIVYKAEEAEVHYPRVEKGVAKFYAPCKMNLAGCGAILWRESERTSFSGITQYLEDAVDKGEVETPERLLELASGAMEFMLDQKKLLPLYVVTVCVSTSLKRK